MISKRITTELWQDITSIGSFIFCSLILISIILTKNFSLALAFFLTLFFVQTLSFIIKTIFFIPRPDNQKYNNILEKFDASSFPSIHSARTISMMILLGLFFNTKFWWIFLIAITILIGISRLKLKRHRIFDVIAGYILGIIVSVIVYILIF